MAAALLAAAAYRTLLQVVADVVLQREVALSMHWVLVGAAHENVVGSMHWPVTNALHCPAASLQIWVVGDSCTHRPSEPMHWSAARVWQLPLTGDAHVFEFSTVQTPKPPTLMASVPMHSPKETPLRTCAHHDAGSQAL